jgi:hypothetical protein
MIATQTESTSCCSGWPATALSLPIAMDSMYAYRTSLCR